jgi:hypothetical protein
MSYVSVMGIVICIKFQRLLVISAALLLLDGCQSGSLPGRSSFTLSIIPDTQNYIDFRHQEAAGFQLDSSELFIQQMQTIAARSVTNGGDISFVSAVGDIWQHQTKIIDLDHLNRGIGIEPDPILARNSSQPEQVLNIEIPKAIEGFRIISDAGVPFSVAPGNHDYDAIWSVAGYSPKRGVIYSELNQTVEDMGVLHIGGLDNFRRVFGDTSDFFEGKSWYIDSFNGGANSAQRFFAGGYNFLHIAIEMQPGDQVISWIESVLANNPGLPTILTTHDFLNRKGERLPHPLIDLTLVDPEAHNSAEQFWQKLISRQDQIFLVLSGHQHGQSVRVDSNIFGNQVFQVMADYQQRGHAGHDAGRTGGTVGIGDGWLRLMDFDFESIPARIRVKTYSSYFKKLSGQIKEYADWYKSEEQPEMSDFAFYQSDDFVIVLKDFNQRFSGDSFDRNK